VEPLYGSGAGTKGSDKSRWVGPTFRLLIATAITGAGCWGLLRQPPILRCGQAGAGIYRTTITQIYRGTVQDRCGNVLITKPTQRLKVNQTVTIEITGRYIRIK
jgi:hypothetical protein